MSPEAAEMLLGEIVPRLKAVVPKCVREVGAEDAEELVQDSIVVAAQMLHNVEQAGKKVTAGNIAYYTILHMKSGRRSQCSSRADVMASGTQLDLRSCVISLEEEVGYDPELDEPIALGELLASRHEDPAGAAARELDWDEFLGSHDYRYGVLIKGVAEGRKLREVAGAETSGYTRVYELRHRLAAELREFMGEEAVEDAVRAPAWKASLMACSERAACAADRRRW